MVSTSRMSFEPTIRRRTTPAHIESLGYTKAMDLLAYTCRVAESDFPERFARLAAGTGRAENRVCLSLCAELGA